MCTTFRRRSCVIILHCKTSTIGNQTFHPSWWNFAEIFTPICIQRFMTLPLLKWCTLHRKCPVGTNLADLIKQTGLKIEMDCEEKLGSKLRRQRLRKNIEKSQTTFRATADLNTGAWTNAVLCTMTPEKCGRNKTEWKKIKFFCLAGCTTKLLKLLKCQKGI